MIIDNQLEGLTYDITANLFDIYLDENNNSFSNIDSLSTTESISKSLSKLVELPKSILTFKKNLMPSIKFEEQKEDNFINKIEINKQKLNSFKNHQLTKQSVKRALFVDKDEIDHDANLKLVNKQMEQLEKQDCEKWNFDFKNNRPLNKSNSQYEWFKNDSILSNSNNLNKLDTNNNLMINKSVKLNLTFDDNCKNDNNERISSSSKYEILLRNNTISNNTRSVKRKLNLDDYFQQSKKRQITSQKDQAKASSDQNLSPVKYSFTDIKRSTRITEAKSIKFQKPTTSKQTINKQIEKRKTRNQRKQKQLDKKQTTLKF